MLGRRVSAKTAISATASQRFDFSFTGSNDTSTRRADKRVAASERWFAEFAPCAALCPCSWVASFAFANALGPCTRLANPLPALSPQGGENVAEGRDRGGSWKVPFRF